MSELRYYDALKRIAAYLPPNKLRREAEKRYGLDYEEALEMAYENVLAEAQSALRGKRRPVASGKSTPRTNTKANGKTAFLHPAEAGGFQAEEVR